VLEPLIVDWMNENYTGADNGFFLVFLSFGRRLRRLMLYSDALAIQ